MKEAYNIPPIASGIKKPYVYASNISSITDLPLIYLYTLLYVNLILDIVVIFISLVDKVGVEPTRDTQKLRCTYATVHVVTHV